MSLLQLPPPRVALRHPSVRLALALLVVGPVWVAWLGKDADAAIRLRVLGVALGVALATSWDDRVHALSAASPVGLPAVRRGRALLVLALVTAAFALGFVGLPEGLIAHPAALALQSAALGALLVAVVAWFGRDGEPVLVVPLPAALVSLAVLVKLPRPLTFLHADPGSAGWPDERARWVGLLVLALLAAAVLGRDAAARYFWRAK
jgi:hypothetical protein